MHLALSTPATAPDTWDATEDAALRQVVAATHLGGPLLPTVQAAVVYGNMLLQQNWTCEAGKLLAEFDATPAPTAYLRIA